MGKKCTRCGKKINPEEQMTSIADYVGTKAKDKHWFHTQCYISWIDEKVEAKVKNFVTDVINQCKGAVDQMKDILQKQNGGS